MINKMSIVSLYLSSSYLKCRWKMFQSKSKEWLSGLKQQQDPLYGTYKRLSSASSTHTHRLKVKDWKKTFHANKNRKRAEVSILTSVNIDFKSKTVKRDKEGHYII